MKHLYAIATVLAGALSMYGIMWAMGNHKELFIKAYGICMILIVIVVLYRSGMAYGEDILYASRLAKSEKKYIDSLK
jgi:hypothetical protein